MAITAMPLRAGDRFTAHAYNRSRPIYAWKTAAKSIASSTTEEADEELLLPLEPFATYLFKIRFAVTGGTTGDFKVSFTVPTGAQGRRHVVGPALTSTGTTANARITVYGWPTSVGYGTGTTTLSVMENAIITTESTGGIVQAQWAQNTSNATATILEAGSFMRAQRVV